ncbi:PIN domain-containing protein [Denitromonas sp.]|uniref:PIN domain-containing protein n=1 Tax=Denitromonas sp. TaxID=2734609 RepID=UPI003A83669C
MRNNYVLIDFENVQPASLAALDAEHFRIVVFIGANQTKITADVAISVQNMGDRAQYVRISGNGPNALDFHIAYYIGTISTQDPTAYFHIVSKDTGFDPLIQHLRSRKILAGRSSKIADIPCVKIASSTTPDERFLAVVENLKQRGAAKPRTEKTLTSTISALFQKKLTDAELTALLEKLKREKYISVNKTRLTYSLPS